MQRYDLAMEAIEPCPICRLPKRRNSEDILPTWARKLLHQSVPRDGTWDFPARVTIRICSDCNSQMATVYEDTTSHILKPMIMGSSVTALSRRDQALVGRWCIKTVMLLHLKQAMSLGVFHEEDAQYLHDMNKGGPPPVGAAARVGKYAGEKSDNGPGEPLRGSLRGAQPLVSFSYMVIGALTVEVLSGTPSAAMDFVDRTQDDDRLVRVWPPSLRSIDFPPSGAITDADLDAMSRELRALSRTTHRSSAL
jgi:hypothetical protein